MTSLVIGHNKLQVHFVTLKFGVVMLFWGRAIVSLSFLTLCCAIRLNAGHFLSRWDVSNMETFLMLRGGAKVSGKDVEDEEGEEATSETAKKGSSSKRTDKKDGKRKARKKGNNRKDLLDLQDKDKKDLSMSIMIQKSKPNLFLADDTISDVEDDSTVILSATKMEELNLFNGDTVILKGIAYLISFVHLLLSGDIFIPYSLIVLFIQVRRGKIHLLL